MKIVTVVGARPQFVKCAALSKELRKHNEEIIVHTGQHYDYEMSKIFFDELEIPPPDYNLEVGSGSHATQTGKILMGVEGVLTEEEPNMVIVFGDTNSTLAGALAAAKMGIKVAHVEAGLRSYDRTMPEEINRVLADHLSNLLFAPTKNAVANLKKEGITGGVHYTGDVMVDTFEFIRPDAMGRSKILDRLNLKSRGYLVLTVHRPSNTDDPSHLSVILAALGKIKYPIIFPIHPRTQKALNENGLLAKIPPNLRLIEPLGYINLQRLMSEARCVITDSGGIQKEAFLLSVRCVTLRENTEWTETLIDNRNILVGVDERKILAAIEAPDSARQSKAEPFGKPGAAVGSLALSMRNARITISF